MSTRTTLRPYHVIEDGDMSADITSSATILQSLSGASYSLSWSGTSPVGELFVQVSNDYSLNPDGSVGNAGTWTGLTLSVDGNLEDSVSITGNSGTRYLNLTGVMAYAVRIFYDRTSGTGTLNAVIVGKVT